jgi:hypothetical protein
MERLARGRQLQNKADSDAAAKMAKENADTAAKKEKVKKAAQVAAAAHLQVAVPAAAIAVAVAAPPAEIISTPVPSTGNSKKPLRIDGKTWQVSQSDASRANSKSSTCLTKQNKRRTICL